MPDPNRQALQNTLKKCLSAEFQQIIFTYGIPVEYLTTHASQAEQAIAVIRYAENRNELPRLAEVIEQHTRPPTTSAAIPSPVAPEQPRQRFIDEYDNDLLLCYAPSLQAQGEALLTILDDLLSQRLGQTHAYRLHLLASTQPDLPELLRDNACTLMLLGADSEIAAPALSRADSKRLFWLETVPGKVAEDMRIWSYRLYSGDTPLSPDNMRYRNQIDTLAYELSEHLQRLRFEAEQRAELAARLREKAQRSNAQTRLGLPEEIVFFIDAAPEDRCLLHPVETLLDNEGAEFTLSIEPKYIQSAADIDTDLKSNLSYCDVFLLLYGTGSAYPAIRHRLALCRRLERERDKPLLAMIVHNQSPAPDKPPPGMKFRNLHVFDCPPESIEEYLPRILQEGRK